MGNCSSTDNVAENNLTSRKSYDFTPIKNPSRNVSTSLHDNAQISPLYETAVDDVESRHSNGSDKRETIIINADGCSPRNENDSTVKVLSDTVVALATGYLAYERNPILRMIFLMASKCLQFMLGAGFYTFPIWLNQVIGENIHLSRSFLSILSGSAYITLGLFGGLLLLISSLRLNRYTEFRILTFVGTVAQITTWSLLYYLSSCDVSSTAGSNLYLIELCMIGEAIGCGVFYMVWFGESLKLVRPDYLFLDVASGSVIFASGTLVTLCVKFYMDNKMWMGMIAGTTIVFVLLVAIFATIFVEDILYCAPPPAAIPPPQDQANSSHTVEDIRQSEISGTSNDSRREKRKRDRERESLLHANNQPVTTSNILYELFTFERIMTIHELQNDDHTDVSSFQFYGLLVTHTALYAMGTLFMANVGIIISGSSDNDETSTSNHREVVILIWATVGQIIGRISVPVITYLIELYIPQYDTKAVANYHHDEGRIQYEKSVRQARVTNRSILFVTFLIGLIFCISLVLFRYTDNQLSFVQSISFLSGGYGMMWGISSSFPFFFPKLNYAIILALFTGLGAMGTLAVTLIVSITKMTDIQIFSVLLFLAITVVASSMITFYFRLNAEIQPGSINKFRMERTLLTLNSTNLKANSNTKHTRL